MGPRFASEPLSRKLCLVSRYFCLESPHALDSLEQPALVEEVDLRLGLRLGEAEVAVGEVGGLAPSGGPDDELDGGGGRARPLPPGCRTSTLIVAARASQPVGPPLKTWIRVSR